MTIFWHELRQGRTALAVWTAAVALLMAACVALFPEMEGGMEEIGALFASMGGFTAAFGMDRLDVGTLTGFYAVECGTILSLGGALYAALTAVTVLSKEERGGTAEFLLAHPVPRTRLVTEKLAAVLVQIGLMDLAVLAAALLSIRAIGQAVPWRTVLPLHLACLLLQVELTGVCLALSALLPRGGAGAGLGLAVLLYMLVLLANMADGAAFLRYVTPFAYCEGADIVARGGLDGRLAALGMVYAVLGAAAAYAVWDRRELGQ